MPVAPRLLPVLARLLTDSEESRTVPLDALGEALGTLSISTHDIDDLLCALETAGRVVGGDAGAGGLEALRKVLPAARELSRKSKSAPTVAAIAEATSLGEHEVRRALLLARVLGR